MKTPKQRGGARKGAGRPVAPIARSYHTVRLSEAERMRALELGKNVTQGVQVALKPSGP
jgi:hypothetical protein